MYKNRFKRTHIAKVVFLQKGCTNGDVYLPLSITNLLLKSLEPKHILAFLISLKTRW